jgi:hypothetical protein
MKRLVLVDRARNRVCGDTSATGPYAQLWTEIATHLEDDVAVLAASAARLLDQSLGETAQDYIFTPFVSARDSDGYLIFDCTCDGGRAPFTDFDPSDANETIRSVMTRCLFVGYVRRKH